MKIPDEAVKAAASAVEFPIRGMNGLRLALSASLPFLTGVKVKALEWVATGQTGFLETEFYAVAGSLMHTVHPLKDVDGAFNEHYSINRDWNDREIWRVTYYVGNNGLSGISKACKSLEAAKAAAQADYDARILSAIEASSSDCECTKIQQDESCPVGYPSLLCDICDGKGFAPSPRAQALEEEIAKHGNKTVTLGGQNYKAILLEDALSVVRALSSQPVADGWFPIETAPKDGTPVLVHFVPNEVPSLKPLICAAYWEKSDGLMKPGFWRVFHSVGPSFTATHWRPLPASPGSSATRPTGGSDADA